MLNYKHLLDMVIIPVLKQMNMHSKEAEILMLGTAIQESSLKHLMQVPTGPALGIYQMEIETHDDLLKNYLSFRKDKLELLEGFKTKSGLLCVRELAGNLLYSTAAARMQYYRQPMAIPKDLRGVAGYWKKYWNTEKGKGTVDQFVSSYNFVVD